MTGRRGGYLIALVTAVLVLVVSVGAVLVFVASGRLSPAGSPVPAPTSTSGGGQQAPGSGMMGGGWGEGMMGDWNDHGTASVTPAQARAAADAWLAATLPGGTMTTGTYAPMGYLFTVSVDGQVVGTLLVDDDTAAVRWWQAPATASPTPNPA